MTVNSIRSMIEREEGRKRSAYKDSLGFLTIGVGRLIDAEKGGGLSDPEIDMLLDNDIRRFTSALNERLPWLSKLDEPRAAVLIVMAFQMGVAGVMGFANTLQAIRDGRYQDASIGMLASKWARQTPERAQRMAEQMRTGQWAA